MKRSKIYKKREPEKEGKLYFIFCEGEKRETMYFHFFNQIASQIIIQIVPHNSNGKNNPEGLFNNACERLIKSKTNSNPEYVLMPEDEVWFIIDTDEWADNIAVLRSKLIDHKNWFVAQSNPCFELWLYYHFNKVKPDKQVNNWKDFLNEIIKGGFDTRKHPAFIERAIENSELNFASSQGQPLSLSTEVHLLAKKILPLVKKDIDQLLSNIEQ